MRPKELLFTVILATLSLGQMCGGPSDAIGGADARLQSNDNLRQACFVFTDADINAELSRLEYSRNQGTTYDQQVQLNYVGCFDSDKSAQGACMTCFTELVDQVYGK